MGGRSNPSSPFFDPWFYDLRQQQWMTTISDGTQPEPRWAHSLVRLGDSLCMLYGGRDHQRVYDDCWSVHITREDDQTVHLSWYLLYESSTTLYNANASPGPRFGSCLLPICSNATNCQHDEVAIVGGRKDLEGTCKQMFVPNDLSSSCISRHLSL